MREAVWIPVFRTGDYGVKGRYTAADLDALVKDYDPKLHEAPVVLGHPETDAPAYGWVKALRRTGELLEALVQPTVQEFVDWVRQGLFKYLSVALYEKLPETGRLYLRHLGFLGATPPEVKGLPPVSFAFDEKAGPFQEVEIGEQVLVEEASARIARGCELLKDRVWWILNDPEQAAKKAEVLSQIDQLRDLVASQEFREAATTKEKGTMKNFWDSLKALFKEQGIQVPEGGPAPSPALAPAAAKTFTEDEVKVRETAAAEKARQEGETRQRLAAHVAGTKAFVEGLKKEGKFLPAWEEMGLVAVLLELPTEATISFSDGKEKKSPAAVMRAFLESLPKLVTLEEVAKAGKELPAPQRDAAAMFAANEGIFHQLGVSKEMLAKAAEAEAAKKGGK